MEWEKEAKETERQRIMMKVNKRKTRKERIERNIVGKEAKAAVIQVGKEKQIESIEALLSEKTLDDKQKIDLLKMFQDEREIREMKVSHVWWDKEKKVDEMYIGRIVCVRKKKKYEYLVCSYWKDGEEEEMGEDYDIPVEETVCDCIFGSFVFL